MAKMRAVEVSRPNVPLELVEREIPDPGAGAVRIKVQACGVCHEASGGVQIGVAKGRLSLLGASVLAVAVGSVSGRAWSSGIGLIVSRCS
jgi:D-arabinose 1-dehydrogenase-like Zn-dependent alcohol dehydrogenase